MDELWWQRRISQQRWQIAQDSATPGTLMTTMVCKNLTLARQNMFGCTSHHKRNEALTFFFFSMSLKTRDKSGGNEKSTENGAGNQVNGEEAV